MSSLTSASDIRFSTGAPAAFVLAANNSFVFLISSSSLFIVCSLATLSSLRKGPIKFSNDAACICLCNSSTACFLCVSKISFCTLLFSFAWVTCCLNMESSPRAKPCIAFLNFMLDCDAVAFKFAICCSVCKSFNFKLSAVC